MSKLDELLANRGVYARTPRGTALADQGAEGMRQQLLAIGIDTTNADQMRGVLGGIVLLTRLHAALGEFKGNTLGAAIMTVADLYPR